MFLTGFPALRFSHLKSILYLPEFSRLQIIYGIPYYSQNNT